MQIVNHKVFSRKLRVTGYITEKKILIKISEIHFEDH